MRLFYLQNELGNRVPLNNEPNNLLANAPQNGGIFLTEPEGLGLEFGDTFADIGEGFFRMVSKKHNQRVIGGKLNFIVKPYEMFNAFVNWCIAAKDLYFVYNPYGTEFYIHVEIESLQKTEMNQLGYMEVPIRLKYLSPWYVPSPAVITMLGEDVTGFTFGDDETEGSQLDGTDVLIGSMAEAYASEIEAYGHLPAAVKITLKGIASNPVFRLVGKETGIEYGRCAIEKSFGSETTIELSTMYENSYVKSIDLLGNETDLLPFVDLTTDPFFKVPLTEDCILNITDADSLSGQVDGRIYYYYRSV